MPEGTPSYRGAGAQALRRYGSSLWAALATARQVARESSGLGTVKMGFWLLAPELLGSDVTGPS